MLEQLEEGGDAGEVTELCAQLRARGSMVDIGQCAGSLNDWVHQPALLLLATLTTTDFDPWAGETKRLIKAGGVHELIWPHLFSNIALTVASTCAVLQNTSARRRRR